MAVFNLSTCLVKCTSYLCASDTIVSFLIRTINKVIFPFAVLSLLISCSSKTEVQSNDASLLSETTQLVKIETELGQLEIKFFPERAPIVVAELISLAETGYFNSDMFLESRPQLGFVMAKTGSSVKAFNFKDESNDLTSARGSVAIAKSFASNAYVNNIFIGYNSQPDIEVNYTIIGQVTKGLELIEANAKAGSYKVNSFKLIYENDKVL